MLMERVPAFLVTGFDRPPMEAAVLGLAWDLPSPVTITHTVNTKEQLLTRVVSDITGVIEQKIIHLDHACVHCAIREDIVPTLARLARSGRWESIVACLPAAADARQVCRMIGRDPERAPLLRIAGVIAAFDGDDLEFDLTGDDLLYDRQLGVFEEDARGIAEVSSQLIEYADLVMVRSPEDDSGEARESLAEGLAMVRSLARPGAMVVTGWPGFDGSQLIEGIHDHDCAEDWVADVPSHHPEPDAAAWRLELVADRPLHPERMVERIEDLGSGTFRSRGCFWVPTRPDWLCAWDGAGGQLSIGLGSRWNPDDRPVTHIVATGLKAHGDPRERIRDAFEACLLTDDEITERGHAWEVWDDGLEPWLGEIRQAA